LDSSLVSNENFSEILPSSGWFLPGNMSQNGHKPTTLMTSLTKNLKPKFKFFFHYRLKDLLSLLRAWTAF